MAPKKTHILCIASRKGGCGKSTTSVNLAAALAHEYRVCVVDTDPQCNSSINLGYDPDALIAEGKKTVADAYLTKTAAKEIALPYMNNFDGRLTVIASNRGLGAVPDRLEADLRSTGAREDVSELDIDDIKNEHRLRLKRSLDSLRGEHCDFVLIDTPPELRFLTTAAMLAADALVIPVFCSKYDLDGMTAVTKALRKVQQTFNPNLKLLGVLVGNFNARARLDKDVRKMLTQTFAESENGVFDTVISQSVRIREATAYDQTIFDHAENEPPANQFLALAREVVTRLGMQGKGVLAPLVEEKEVANV